MHLSSPLDIQKRYTNGILVFTLALFCFSEAEAKQITLRHSKGNFLIKGKLLKFENGAYIVHSSRFGKMTVNANNFICVDGACPENRRPINNIKHSTKNINKRKLLITGSSTIGTDLMPSLIEAWASTKKYRTKRIYTTKSHQLDIQLQKKKKAPSSHISVQTNGSATAFPALANGTADIGMSSRKINQNEIRQMRKSGVKDITHPYREHILALDGLQIIVSPKNSVSSLSLEEIAGIYSGKIKNWSAVGGKPGKINLYTREKQSGTFSTFNKLILKPRSIRISDKAKKILTHSELSDSVARDPESIGFTDIAYARNARVISISTSCSAPQYPTSFAVKTEEYPLSFRVYLYTTGKSSNSLTKEILRFAISERAQPVIKQHGLVDQRLEALPFSKQAGRIVTGIASSRHDEESRQINSFSQEFADAERLSATFRFKKKTAVLDNRSLKDLKRLATLLGTPRYRNKKIFLVGFTDTKGAAHKNTMISLKRADKVKNALLAAARGKIPPYRVHVRGYGKLLPVACNNTAIGRWKNRRVEVWLK